MTFCAASARLMVTFCAPMRRCAAMAVIDEEILGKTGGELFKELFRVYPTAEVEDYFKAGQWKDDVMKLDIQLFYSHAREAGAPYPPPIEELKFPPLPKTLVATGIGIVRPGMPGAVRPPPAVRPLILGSAPVPVGTVAGATPAASGPAAELRLIALFVTKWKLDPTRTKLMLAKLTPQRRRYVIQNFKVAVPGTATDEATNALETFIAECESSGSWGPAIGTLIPTATLVTPRPAGVATAPRPGMMPRPLLPAGLAVPMPVGAMKRPLTQTMVNPAFDASKRPRAITPKAGGMLAPGKGVQMPPRPVTPPGLMTKGGW